MTNRESILARLRGGVVVSCQADEGDPLCRPDIMAAVAAAAQRGGAAGVRVRGFDHIQATRALVSVTVIGLTKQSFPNSPVYITPTWEDVRGCLEAGADIVALDATDRPRPDGLSLAEIVRRAREMSSALLWADIAQPHEGEQAQALGFDVVSTTLAGYTGASAPTPGPDLNLLRTLVGRLEVPVVAEGRFTTPVQVAEALDLGAWAVCVGKAITDPGFITSRYMQVEPGTPHGPPE
jgi:N-acylglucosamine-6-phosphate 2-epimerase